MTVGFARPLISVPSGSAFGGNQQTGQHGGLWFPWTLEMLAAMVAIEETANEIYGSGSHWLEEREA
jgi:hypothetical protein